MGHQPLVLYMIIVFGFYLIDIWSNKPWHECMQEERENQDLLI